MSDTEKNYLKINKYFNSNIKINELPKVNNIELGNFPKIENNPQKLTNSKTKRNNIFSTEQVKEFKSK